MESLETILIGRKYCLSCFYRTENVDHTPRIEYTITIGLTRSILMTPQSFVLDLLQTNLISYTSGIFILIIFDTFVNLSPISSHRHCRQP